GAGSPAQSSPVQDAPHEQRLVTSTASACAAMAQHTRGLAATPLHVRGVVMDDDFNLPPGFQLIDNPQLPQGFQPIDAPQAQQSGGWRGMLDNLAGQFNPIGTAEARTAKQPKPQGPNDIPMEEWPATREEFKTKFGRDPQGDTETKFYSDEAPP